MTDEYKETDYEVVEPVSENDEAPIDTEAEQPETIDEEPALDPDVETTGVLSATDTSENPLSDEEAEAQANHEALAETLAPGETLPWVAPTPSAVQPPEIVAPDPQENIKDADQTIPSSRHESAENAPDTE